MRNANNRLVLAAAMVSTISMALSTGCGSSNPSDDSQSLATTQTSNIPRAIDTIPPGIDELPPVVDAETPIDDMASLPELTQPQGARPNTDLILNDTMVGNLNAAVLESLLPTQVSAPICAVSKERCELNFSKKYEVSGKVCKITYYKAGMNFQPEATRLYFTNCGTCRQAVLQGLGGDKKVILDVLEPSMDSFMVETLQGYSCELKPEFFSRY